MHGVFHSNRLRPRLPKSVVQQGLRTGYMGETFFLTKEETHALEGAFSGDGSKIHSFEIPPEIKKAIAALPGPCGEGHSEHGRLTVQFFASPSKWVYAWAEFRF